MAPMRLGNILQASRRPGTISSLLALLVLSVFLQIRWGPPNHKMQLDGTVFAYAGKQILDGDIPYKDFWDHKPPGVYYLNSLAFLIGPADAWTIWFLTVSWTIFIAIAFYALLSKILTKGSAVLLTGVLLATLLQPKFYEGSNMTEFYGVLPSVASLLLAFLFLERGDNRFAVGLGAAFAAGALLKQTNVGTSLACIAVILLYQSRVRGIREGLRSLGAVCIPVVISLLVVGTFWYSQGALAQLWQSTVEYNLLYVEGNWGVGSLYGALREVATDPSLSPLLVIALAAALGFAAARRHALGLWLAGDRGPDAAIPLDFLFLAVFLSLFSEIALVALAAGKYGHYFLTLPPVLCAASSYWLVRKGVALSPGERWDGGTARATPFVFGGLAVWLVATVGLVRPSMDQIGTLLRNVPTRTPAISAIDDYVMDTTEPDESVLVWGLGAELNFETGRRSPTPYVYYLPLFMGGFHNGELWDRFLADLRDDPPALIIAPRESGSAPRFYASEQELHEACGCQGEILSGFTEFSRFVSTRYHREPALEDQFVIFRLDDSQGWNLAPEGYGAAAQRGGLPGVPLWTRQGSTLAASGTLRMPLPRLVDNPSGIPGGSE